ncbi:MAG TPA: hypothetical protein VMR28_01205 [Candidatus Saccharimonadales bacterium]|nr:hypothetical protein [Candidatus Saccharimonadales bacterium]
MDDNKPVEPEEFDSNSLANALLGKEENNKSDENKGEESAKSDPEAKKTTEEDSKLEDKPEDKSEDTDKPEDGKSKEGEDDKDSADPAKPEDKPADDKVESKPAEEDFKPLSREDIRAAMREEAEERERATSERTTFAGKVREDLKEALKLDSTQTTISLEDGTPVTSVTQLTQVINPETDEPYTREEASTLLLDAQRIVQENLASYEKRVDELTDLNVDFKEQSDEVDRLYGDILKAFPEEAKGWLEAYKKTFTISEDGSYVENVPISPLEFYGPILKPYRNATDQINQQQVDAKVAEEKAKKQAEVKAEQEDRGDLGGNAGSAQGKSNPLADALDNYLKN